MSLHIAAQNLASQGRGPDNTLVHMSRKEVNSLNSLARAHGGHLTINPNTGLPEAGFLSSILPMMIGAGLTVASGGALSPLMAAGLTGAGYGIATGSLQKGLMAGLGAYGGAGLGAGLTEAGLAEAAVPGAAPVSPTAPTSFPTEASAYQSMGATPGQYGAMGETLAQAPAQVSAGYEGLSPTPSQYGAMGEAPIAAPVVQATPQVAPAATAPVSIGPTSSGPGFGTESARAAAQENLANMSPTERLSQAGRGIGALGTNTGQNAFMDKVGGGSGLFKYGMAAAAPMLTGKDQAGYKSSGPNPYEYSYDYKTGQYTRQPTGYRDAQTVTPPQAMAMGGMAQGGLDFAGQNTFAAGGGPGGLNMNALQQQQMTQQPQNMASGGMSDLGSYSDGGRMLRGPGDGVSDSIPAMIGSKRPARLADGEFVVPARVVSELGNGSSEAGARKLYAMMDRVQGARKKSIGKGKLAVNSRADKMLPA